MIFITQQYHFRYHRTIALKRLNVLSAHMKTSGEQEKLYLSRGSFSEGKNGKQNVYSRFVDNNQRRALHRALLKAKAIGIPIAWVTEKRKVNK